MATTLLVQSGLSEKEAQIYLLLIEEGGKTVQEISTTTGIKRGNVYYLVDKLAQLELLEETIAEKKNVFSVRHPKIWQTYFERKRRSLEESERKLLHKLPDLISRYKLANDETGLYQFEGREEIIKIYQGLIKDGLDLDIISGSNALKDIMPDYTKFFLKKLASSGIKSRMLTDKKTGSLEEDHSLEFQQIISAPFLPDMEICISKKKIVLISNEVDKLVAIVLTFPKMVKDFQTIFDKFWSISTEK